MKLLFKIVSTFLGAQVSARWSEGTITNDGPLMVIYIDDWAGWQRLYYVSNTENNVLSRNMPVRNWVLNYAFLAWNPVECRIGPVDHEVEFSKADPSLYPSAPGWWTPDSWASTYTSGTIPALLSLKQKYPHIKILPSIGGWSRSHTFHQCLIDKPEVMIQSSIDVVNSFGFDGIDFDWEYPNCAATGAKCGCQGEDTCKNTPNVAGEGDWDRYKSFLTDLRTAFDDLEDKMQRRLYITAALGVNPKLLDGKNDIWTVSTPIEWICDNDVFDWVNLMTYDFYGPWAAKTGPLSPLYSTPDDVCKEGKNQMSIEDSLDRILARCSRPEKLTLGMPTYGKIWQNVPKGDGAVPGLWQEAEGSTPMATGTWEAGTVSIWDIEANYLTSKECEPTFDDISKTATVYCETHPLDSKQKNIFISYDNGDAWKAKMEYARSKGMAGGIVWAASDLGTLRGDEIAEELYGGALEGWYGETQKIDPPHSNGRTAFVVPKPWKNFPCPIPYGANIDSTAEITNPCYSSSVDGSQYGARDHWEMATGANEVDAIGNNVIMIHPLDGETTMTPSKKTTVGTTTKRVTTRAATTKRTTTTTKTRAPTARTTPSKMTTKRPTTKHVTTKPTTKREATTGKRSSARTTTAAKSTTEKTSPVIRKCQDVMNWEGQDEQWLGTCQHLCSYYAGSEWCDADPATADSATDVDALIKCVEAQADYCTPRIPSKSAIQQCEDAMDWEGQVEQWVVPCQNLCSYYTQPGFCDKEAATDAEVLIKCLESYAGYCAPK